MITILKFIFHVIPFCLVFVLFVETLLNKVKSAQPYKYYIISEWNYLIISFLMDIQLNTEIFSIIVNKEVRILNIADRNQFNVARINCNCALQRLCTFYNLVSGYPTFLSIGSEK